MFVVACKMFEGSICGFEEWKVLLLGFSNSKEPLCSSWGVVGTIPYPSGIGKNIGAKFGGTN